MQAADRTAPVARTSDADPTTRNAEETKAPDRLPKDGYKPKDQTQEGMLRDGPRRPPRPLGQLLPQVERFAGQDMKQLAQRFGSDLAILRPDLMPPQLSGKDQAARLWQFFSAYGKAAAHAGNAEGLEAFREALEQAGFLRFKDQHTGKSGLDRALWGLRAETPEAARTRMASVDLVPMKEEAHLPEGSFHVQQARAEQQQSARQEAKSPLHQPPAAQEARPGERPQAEAAMLLPAAAQQEALRVNVLAAQAAAAQIVRDARDEPVERDSGRRSGRSSVLGSQMLFNALHTLRGEGEDSVEARDRFNRLAFAAVLLLVGATLAIIALVAL